MSARQRCVGLLCSGLALACVPSKSSSDTAASESSSTDDPGTDGSGTNDSGTETSTNETGEPECDQVDHVACRAPVLAAYDECMAGCEAPDSCAGAACGWSCDGERELALIACAEQAHCWSYVDDIRRCEAECAIAAGECSLTADCHPYDCDFAEMVCVVENCHICGWTEFEYAYAGSCEIQLPGTVPTVKRGYTFVAVDEPDYMSWELRDDPLLCDEPGTGGIWKLPNYDGISLCPTTCDAFALAGSLRVVIGSPPCE